MSCVNSMTRYTYEIYRQSPHINAHSNRLNDYGLYGNQFFTFSKTHCILKSFRKGYRKHLLCDKEPIKTNTIKIPHTKKQQTQNSTCSNENELVKSVCQSPFCRHIKLAGEM